MPLALSKTVWDVLRITWIKVIQYFCLAEWSLLSSDDSSSASKPFWKAICYCYAIHVHVQGNYSLELPYILWKAAYLANSVCIAFPSKLQSWKGKVGFSLMAPLHASRSNKAMTINFIEMLKTQTVAKHKQITLSRIRLRAKLPCHKYNLWLYLAHFCLAESFKQ